MTKLHQLHADHGQSPWLANLTRGHLRGGEVRWSRPLPDEETLPVRMLGDTVVALVGDELLSLDAGNGEQRWHVTAPPRPICGPRPPPGTGCSSRPGPTASS